ncbi:uncharacterized protein K460DRAFT_409635 [Cucurbitaria berberidis CBS 394.84]|uniref:Heterokaryon incompatibility domain-containing protein n=1 Tax=Cucurbitaria berberidis CBS 394.84 TaxID=1168544 RepID=A0A9P4GB66_9PLEO|nr:uncharacterized protein K460DRAFT_409635 [Cucurbitaria berberidis CBS 394.84]KAF1842217.1 hypothetical protein K460DRAFT_409635 [Cucurbitaria berberidis CBS 394.84]
MRDIYERAWNVVIWLGQGWDNFHLVMRYLEQMGQNQSFHIHPAINPSLQLDGRDITAPEIQKGLKMFFGSSWWTRVWTVQEYLLSRRSVFQCGRYLLDRNVARQGVQSYFHHLERCCSALRSDCPNHNDIFKSLIVMENVEYIRLLLQDVSLPYIFSQFRNTRDATDMRDKIFGMLGLARGQYQNIIRPNYLLSTEQNFELATVEIMKNTRPLEILSHIPVAGERNLSLPSYVPDWTVSAKDDYYYTDWLNWVGHLHLYNACKDEVADLEIIEPGVLALKGSVIEEIDLVGSVPGSVSYGAFLEELISLAAICKDANRDPIVVDWAPKTAFWSVICGTMENYLDSDRDNRPFYRRILPLSSFERFDKWISWYPSNSAIGMDAEVLSTHRPFIVVSAGRKFAVTKKGRLAWCPVKSNPGDVIAILAGGSVPFVLRIGDNGRYTVVGDAYIQGIMDGEILTDDLEFIELI